MRPIPESAFRHQPAQRARHPAEEEPAGEAQGPAVAQCDARVTVRCPGMKCAQGWASRDAGTPTAARRKRDHSPHGPGGPQPFAAMPEAEQPEYQGQQQECSEQHAREDRRTVAIKHRRVLTGHVMVQEGENGCEYAYQM